MMMKKRFHKVFLPIFSQFSNYLVLKVYLRIPSIQQIRQRRKNQIHSEKVRLKRNIYISF